MKTNSKQKDRNYGLGVLLLLITIIMVGCVYLDSININQNTNPEEEPVYWVKAGEVATFTVKGHIEAAEDATRRFLVAILVPKSWNARENTTVTYVADGV